MRLIMSCVAVVFFAFMTLMPAKADVTVGGPAGSVTSVWFDGSCYWGRNNGSRRVRLHLGSAITTDLNPGQSTKFVGPFGCPKMIGAPTAEYI